MKLLSRFITGGVLLILIMSAAPAGAEIVITDSSRSGRWEMFLLTNWTDTNRIDFKGGSEVSLNKDFGWGFGFAYNVNEHISLGTQISWNSTNFDVDTFSGTGEPVNMSGRLDSDRLHFTATYYFFDKEITPFVTGGFGMTYVDSNIPSGPSDTICWWDPWWGYVCRTYRPTHTETSFSYSLGAGLRMDVTNAFFLSASINNTWIDLEKASDIPDFLNSRFFMGFVF